MRTRFIALIGRALLVATVLAHGCGGRECYAQSAQAQYRWHGAAALPDPNRTPGLADPGLTTAALCSKSFHTGTVRNVPFSEKASVCRAYGVQIGCPGVKFELDHLISIELGGSNGSLNLWPQPVDGPGIIGFHTKDVVENRAHAAVCAGKLTLADAQKGIAQDWYAFGLANGFVGPAKPNP